MDSRAYKSDELEQTAVRWFARRHGSAWITDDQAQLDAWLAAATAHRIHYVRVENAWNQAARLKALGAGVPPGVIPPRESWGDTRFLLTRDLGPEVSAAASNATSGLQRRRVRGPYVAAAALALLGTGLYALNAGWFGGSYYSTPIGGRDEVLLADGSNVTLNTDTRIEVSFDEHERRIQLERGEAYFDVAQETARPFVVHAGDKRVAAVGTRFAVRRDREDIRVIVTEGRVRVTVAATLLGGRTVAAVAVLDAGAVARTANAKVLIREDAAAEADKLLSWRRGYVSFDNVPLADAVAEFNRYSPRKMVIEDPGIAGIRVGGHFRSTNTAAFLDFLRNGFSISAREERDRVLLRGH